MKKLHKFLSDKTLNERVNPCIIPTPVNQKTGMHVTFGNFLLRYTTRVSPIIKGDPTNKPKNLNDSTPGMIFLA